jgi:hypothetical protein
LGLGLNYVIPSGIIALHVYSLTGASTALQDRLANFGDPAYDNRNLPLTAQSPPLPPDAPLYQVLQTLEDQLIVLDTHGAMIAAAHVSAAV